jgi:hypothetical protein
LQYAKKLDIIILKRGDDVMIHFNKSRVKDERITHIQNKIYAEIYILVIVICGVSMGVKHYVYGLYIEDMATELIILIASGVYYVYRSASLGIFSAEMEMHDRKSKRSKQKKNLIASIALGIGIALYFGINSAVRYADGLGQSIYYFLLTAAVSLMIYLPFFIMFLVVGNEIMKRKSEKAINKMLGDDDEPGDDDEKY